MQKGLFANTEKNDILFNKAYTFLLSTALKHADFQMKNKGKRKKGEISMNIEHLVYEF